MSKKVPDIEACLKLSPPPFVIDYSEHKDKLWAMLACTKNELASTEFVRKAIEKQLVVLWDETDRLETDIDGVKVGEYLNPLTWAACMAATLPKMSVTVLDCDPIGHSQGKFYGFVQAIDQAQLPFAFLNDPAGWVSAFEDKRKHPSARTQLVRDVLLTQIRTLLTAPGDEGDHHALASIIGPMMLKGWHGIRDEKQWALSALFSAVGFIVPKERNAEGRNEYSQRLLIVDDQVEKGWDEWVALMAPAAKVGKISSPAPLLAAVKTGLDKKGLHNDCRFSLELPEGESVGAIGERTINGAALLLDLRLFPGRLRQEADFVKTVLPLCDGFIKRGKNKARFAWPGFSEAELRTVSAWCDQPKFGTRAHLIALSLFPRLLALTDMSIPIILFSSTGQRRVLELLKPYGNIITCFAKPRFTSLDNTDIIKETEERFSEALGRASAILSARTKCCSIDKYNSSGMRFPESKEATPGKKTRYVELFLDETQNADAFSVGGCFAVYESSGVGTAAINAAMAKADKFDDYLVEKGVRYFDNRGVGPASGDGTLRKKDDDISKYVAEYEKSEFAPGSLGLVRVTLPRPRREGQNALVDPFFADNRFHMAIKHLLELFFCESLNALAAGIGSENLVFSVFAGTRVAEIRDSLAQNEAVRRFGFRRLIKSFIPPLFYSFGSNEVYPIIADIQGMHRLRRRFDRLIAVQLPYHDQKSKLQGPEFFRCCICNRVMEVSSKGTPPVAPNTVLRCRCEEAASWRPDYRALHYLADAVLTEFPSGAVQPYDGIFKRGLVTGEFDEVVGEGLTATIASGRLLDSGDIAKAVSLFVSASDKSPAVAAKPRAFNLLGSRLAAKLPEMSGSDFLRIAS